MRKSYSQKQIAAYMGVSQQRISDMKAGRYASLSKRTAIRLSKKTGLNIHDLFEMDYEEIMKAMGEAMKNAGIIPMFRGRVVEAEGEADIMGGEP